jgi:hypothetical protein
VCCAPALIYAVTRFFFFGDPRLADQEGQNTYGRNDDADELNSRLGLHASGHGSAFPGPSVREYGWPVGWCHSVLFCWWHIMARRHRQLLYRTLLSLEVPFSRQSLRALRGKSHQYWHPSMPCKRARLFPKPREFILNGPEII